MLHLYLFSISEQLHHWRGTLLVLGIGLVIGALWAALMKWRSLGYGFSILTGALGAWLYLSFCMGYYTYSHKHVWNEVICALVGAIALTATLNLLFGSNRGKDRTFWRA